MRSDREFTITTCDGYNKIAIHVVTSNSVDNALRTFLGVSKKASGLSGLLVVSASEKEAK